MRIVYCSVTTNDGKSSKASTIMGEYGRVIRCGEWHGGFGFLLSVTVSGGKLKELVGKLEPLAEEVYWMWPQGHISNVE